MVTYIERRQILFLLEQHEQNLPSLDRMMPPCDVRKYFLYFPLILKDNIKTLSSLLIR